MPTEKRLQTEFESFAADQQGTATEQLVDLIRSDDMVGDVLKMDYAECDVLVHDHLRQKVGGLPLGCFLIATRVAPNTTPLPEHEDTNLILLRVIGQSRLPNAAETDNNRFLAGQRVAQLDDVWDADGRTDQFTLHQLRHAGVLCRIVGTFRIRQGTAGEWKVVFGADISNFYSGRGLKVYKPVGKALYRIVNFTKPGLDDSHPLAGKRVTIGRVRYASSEVQVDSNRDNVEVNLDPTDLIARRTALFGMSRTGKSNTTKMIAASVFQIRETSSDVGKVGQLIFDVNGEYANENTQDGDCLKNIYRITKDAIAGDVSTYGLAPHPNDPGRKIVKINFFGSNPSNWLDEAAVSAALEPLLVGKSLIDNHLAKESSKYIANFRNTSLEIPSVLDRSSTIRFHRAIIVYRTVLHAAGFRSNMTKVNIKGLFNSELIAALANSNSLDSAQYHLAANHLRKDQIAWDEAIEVFRALRRFIQDGQSSGYAAFDSNYAQGHDGRSWHDERLTGLLAILEYSNGPRSIRGLLAEHDPSSATDYAKDIVADLGQGKLVIFDQSLGDPTMNRAAAERIMWAIFSAQKNQFISPEIVKGEMIPPKDVLVYAEEAHNLLPAGSATDVENIWSRVAKEGSKYRIGLIYATQEPSSIQSNILKNTDNWFVAHLNNSDETKELKKYYDFSDFIQSILQVPDAGFIRMRTLSNPYIVPVQINRFTVATQ